MRRISPPIAAVLALAACAGLPVAAQAPAGDEVRIYRCTDAQGRTSIGNLPCASGDTQQVRGMVRPVDAPAAPRASPRDDVAADAPPPRDRVVVLREPRPLYECTTPDGDRYDSDDDEGNPRWVPYWTSDYGYGGYGGYPVALSGGGSGISASRRSGVSAPGPSGVSVPGPSGVSAPLPGRGGVTDIGDRPRPPRGRGDGHRGGYGGGYGGGSWIRDDCRRLPAVEACARLDDRLDESRRRFFNAQQRERDVLRVEERALMARMAEDCG